MNKFVVVIFLMLGLFVFGLTCADPHEEPFEHHLMEALRHYQTPVVYDDSLATLTDDSSWIAVHAELPGISDFFTENRIKGLRSYPCSNCHTQSLEQMQADRSAGTRKAHWDIHLVHAAETTMSCTTCHARDNLDQLVSLTGKLINLNESFKLCGQCHSSQYKDWQGGAHGKEINGWKPPRVATTCVSCHNPHQPAFPKRFPARLNTHERGQ